MDSSGKSARNRENFRGDSNGGAFDAESPLKIIIAGTPKTGNTWLKFLLAEVYGLSVVELQPEHRADDWDSFGPRWVGHQHYQPQADLLERARASGVLFITLMRHPADVLVSLRHYVRDMGEQPTSDPLQAASMLLDCGEDYGEHTRRFVEHGFYLLLHTSICWLRCGESRIARYEDLWERPLETLRRLTESIRRVSEEELRRAIRVCEIDGLRAAHGAKLFRKGGTGSWRTELPREIQRCLANWDPYPAQFTALGYSMNADEGASRRDDATASASWKTARQFDNGTAIAPILKELYSELPKSLTARWPSITSTAPASFFSWLNAPAVADPLRDRAVPLITELAHYLHSIRPDVRALYPDPFGERRMEFGNWFAYYATVEYGLDDVFTLPVIQSVAGRCPVNGKVHSLRAEASAMVGRG